MEQEHFVDPGRAIGFFRQLEERLLHPEVRSSGDELSRLLADDFIEFYVVGPRHRLSGWRWPPRHL